MADDKDAAVPASFTLRVFDLLHDEIGRSVDRFDGRRRPLLALKKKVGVPLEEAAIVLVIAEIPGLVAALIDEFGRAPYARDKAGIKVLDDDRDAARVNVCARELQAFGNSGLDFSAADRPCTKALPEQQHGHACNEIFTLIHVLFARLARRIP
jgi:hypothetical protein